MSEKFIILSIIVAAIATYLTRILPFLFFTNKKPSKILFHFEQYMPMMIMVILVFYAIKDVSFGEFPYAIPELLGVLVAILIHLKFKNALLSIFSATALYMFLIQKVFI